MIIHADMDAFYASVELLDKPHLKDKPVAVGGPSKNRGVISAANYIARQFGVHSALPCAIATRRCPQLILFKPRMSLYADYSGKIKKIFARYTPIIEPLSLDEAFLDTSKSEKLFGNTVAIGKRIKDEIKNELGLTVSIGIAPNKFIAKIASDVQKPDGFVIVLESEIQKFLDPLPVARIWGIGKVSSARLNSQGIFNIAQLRQLPEAQLKSWFGKHGTHLHQLAHGLDNRKVVTDHHAKSISNESTFDTNLTHTDIIHSELLQLTEQVAARLRHIDSKGRTISIKVRFADFKTVTRSASIALATNSTNEIWRIIKDKLLSKVNLSYGAIRLLGVELSQFEPHEIGVQQWDFFETCNNKNSKLDKLTDDINERFGNNAITRATTIRNED